jgi:hypothetical protein
LASLWRSMFGYSSGSVEGFLIRRYAGIVLLAPIFINLLQGHHGAMSGWGSAMDERCSFGRCADARWNDCCCHCLMSVPGTLDRHRIPGRRHVYHPRAVHRDVPYRRARIHNLHVGRRETSRNLYRPHWHRTRTLHHALDRSVSQWSGF